MVQSKDEGGLGIGCLESVNLSLLAKWRWRLKSGVVALRSSCITAMHKAKFIDGKPVARSSLKGVWYEIAYIDGDLEKKGVILEKLFQRVVGKGDRTYFWKDAWCGDLAFKDLFPNLYLKESQKDCLVADRINHSADAGLVMVWNWKDRVRSGRESGQLADLKQVIADFRFANGPDSWCWKGGGIDFSVNNLRNLMDASVGGPVTGSFG